MYYFNEHLRRQIGFLERSAHQFDEGHREESVRIATGIRVIFHDTSNSTSLLAHLGTKDATRILTSVPPNEPPVPTCGRLYIGLYQRIGPDGVEGPGFRDLAHDLPAPEWWDQIVFVFGSMGIRRKDIVLAAANKDGGAHVDTETTIDYQTAQALLQTEEGQPYNIAFNALRTMAFELLNSPQLLSQAGIEPSKSPPVFPTCRRVLPERPPGSPPVSICTIGITVPSGPGAKRMDWRVHLIDTP